MKYRDYNKKEDNSIKNEQIKMIKKHYKQYKSDDWVLWIVVELFHKYKVKDLTGTIEIKKNDGNLIEIPFVVRTPYPNKKIHQISMKSGLKRLYGIPLVFDSYESLCEVSDVIIKWDIYEEGVLKDKRKALDLHITHLTIKYHLSFEKNKQNKNYRFFTIFSKDNTYDIYNNDSNDSDKYYEEFDIALNVVGNINCDSDDKWKSLIYDTYTLKNKVKSGKFCELSSAEEKTLDELYKLLPNQEKAEKLLQNVVMQSEIQWSAYCYEKTEVLIAAYMADILPNPLFGF